MEVPESFQDPINYQLMEDAVITPDGITYSEKSIRKWLNVHQFCPMTQKPLKPDQLIPNRVIRDLIADWKKNKLFNAQDTIKYSDLKFGKPIAKGATSDVYEGNWLGQKVAIKKLRISNPTKKQLDSFKTECAIASMFRHPSLNTVYGFVDEDPEYCIVSDYCSKGTFQQKILNKNCSKNELLTMMKDVVSGLVFLHKKRIIHRDIKPQNILIAENGKPKLTDFGLSKILQHTMDQTTGLMSTPVYTAPEILSDQPYSFSSDVYSIGCILWQIDTREERPWNDLDSPFALTNLLIHQKKKLTPSPNCPKDLRDLINACVQHDPKLRPSMKEVLDCLEKILKSRKAKKIKQKGKALKNVEEQHYERKLVDEKSNDKLTLPTFNIESDPYKKKIPIRQSPLVSKPSTSTSNRKTSSSNKIGDLKNVVKEVLKFNESEHPRVAKAFIESTFDCTEVNRNYTITVIADVKKILPSWSKSVETALVQIFDEIVKYEKWKTIPNVFKTLGYVFGRLIFAKITTMNFADALLEKYSSVLKKELLFDFSTALMQMDD